MSPEKQNFVKRYHLHIAVIALFIGLFALLTACDATKRVPKNEYLLRENRTYLNGTRTEDAKVNNFILQKPNSYILGMPVSLYIYNLGNPKAEQEYWQWLDNHPRWHNFLNKTLSKKQVGRLGKSFLVSGLSKQLQRIGEAPAILDTAKVSNSSKRLGAYYNSIGYFNAKVKDTIVLNPKGQERRAEVDYYIQSGDRYYIDSLSTAISSPEIDSIYELHQNKSLLKRGEPYQLTNFAGERSRLYELFRNNGFYTFQQNSINFEVQRDTVQKQGDRKINVKTTIGDLVERDGDVITTKPYKIHYINRVYLHTDYDAKEDPSKLDSIVYSNLVVYYKDKLHYRIKILAHAAAMRAGRLYSDTDRSNTYRQINNLRIFRYPTIEYKYTKGDSLQNKLDAHIYLTPLEKFSLRLTQEVKRSEIEAIGFGLGTTFSARNVFRGAEILEVGLQGAFASQPTLRDTRFFNTSEISGDVKLIFPSILFPINTGRLIPYYMTPQTIFQVGMSYQTNIGLDKRTTSGVLRYVWNPRKRKDRVIFDLFNVQYVNNLNPGNFFNIYQSTYERLNDIARNYNLGSTYVDARGDLTPNEGTFRFMQDVFNGNITLQTADYRPTLGVLERYNRLTNNDFIVSTSFTYIFNNSSQFFQNDFWQFRMKAEAAGGLLNALATTYNVVKTDNNKNKLLGVEYAQFVKGELDYIKHLPVGRQSYMAFRTFFGIAIPYGNSSNIPFSQSYFAGGTSDNRGWRAYRLGPGSSNSILDYNEANMKLTLNAEFRFPILGQLKGALFADAGNIWNVADDTRFEEFKFKGLSSLKDIGVSSGLGFRYDFNFFVIRLDIGNKTYDPAYELGNRWFKSMNLKDMVFNFGINYPF